MSATESRLAHTKTTARVLALALIIAGCDGPVAGPPQHGTVTVHVARGADAIGEATIVFHDQNGDVLGTARTDANGLATGEVVEGGAVTVIDPLLEHYLTTVTGVLLDSTIEIPLRRFGTKPPSVMITIAAPTTAPPQGSAGYSIQTPCESVFVDALPATILIPAPCGSGTPVVLYAFSESGLDAPGVTLAWAAARVEQDNVARPDAWSTTCSTVSLDADIDVGFSVFPRFGGHVFDLADLRFCEGMRPTYPTLDFGEGALMNAWHTEAPGRRANVIQNLATLPSTIEVDSDDDMLLGWIGFDGFDEYGASWTPNEPLADVDAVEATLGYVIGSGNSVTWRVVLPPDAREALLPQLPQELVTWGHLADARNVNFELRYIDASWIDGNLAAVHADLPVLVEPSLVERDVAPGRALRDYWQKFEPSVL